MAPAPEKDAPKENVCSQDPNMFAFPEQIERLDEVGFTRSKSTQQGYTDGYWRGFTLDTGYLVAPQNFKSDELYAKFPGRPRQMQTLYCGQWVMPIPSGPRTFYKGENQDAQDLAQCVWVRGFYVPHEELRGQLRDFFAQKSHPVDNKTA